VTGISSYKSVRFYNVLKEVSSAHQDCIYVIKKSNIMTIFQHYYSLSLQCHMIRQKSI